MTVGAHCFKMCDALSRVTFAKGSCLKTIKEFAFESCLKLEEMEIPARVETIESSAFFNSGLKRIAFETGCCLKHIESNALANCPLKEIEIPANVKCIDAFCFAGCPLTKVTFAGGHSLKRIEESAFHHCDSIEEIEIPASLEEPVSPLNTGEHLPIRFSIYRTMIPTHAFWLKIVSARLQSILALGAARI